MADACRCSLKVQPFARELTVGTKLTCTVHTARWTWDGVAFIPEPTWWGFDAEWMWHSKNWVSDADQQTE